MANVKITSDQLIPKYIQLRTNPQAIARLTIDSLEAVGDGVQMIVDPSNSFVQGLEMAVTLAAASMQQDEALNRKQYGSAAVTDEDLYHHMSDYDYLGRFGSPSRTTIGFTFVLEELKQYVVDLGDGSGAKKLTIPRNTYVEVAGYRFTMQYPIDIIIMAHGGVNILYDNTINSPLQTLESNRVEWTIKTRGTFSYLTLFVPMDQISINVQQVQLNSITGFTKAFAFTDNFYTCRAFMKNSSDGSWTEVKTTHTDQVYDPANVTAVLKVLNQQLVVNVPQIYFNNGLIKDSLMVWIYTTSGPLEMTLEGYASSAYKARFVDNMEVSDNRFSAPLSKLTKIGLFGDSSVTGGAAAVPFATLREQVITRSLSAPDIPITPPQLQTKLSQLGYSLVMNLDNVTDRQFLASRALPAPSNDSTVTGAGAAISMFQFKMTDLAGLETTSDNGDRITLLPSTVYKSVNGVLSIVPHSLVTNLQDINVTTPEQMALAVNAGSYFYSPFHYVLDVTDDVFQTRAYRLDKPSVVSKFFFQENIALLASVSSKAYAIDNAKDGSGYILAIELDGSEAWSALPEDQRYVQLSYKPNGSSSRVTLMGVKQPSTTREIYYFYITTDYDVDSSHNLILTPQKTTMALTTEFDIVYIARNHLPVGATTSDIDNIIDDTLLPAGSIYRGVVQEKIVLKFGDHLKHLYTKSRSVISPELYQRYTVDVPAVYEKTVFLRDSSNNIELTWNPGTEEFEYTVLHEAGDPILDTLGNPTYRHRVGDLVLNAFNEAIPIGGSRGMLRQTDIFLLDGRYYFATSDATRSYVKETVDLVAQWILTDIDTISKRLLERTTLSFNPKTTIGKLKANVGNGLIKEIEASQNFVLRLHLTKEKYDNEALRASLALTGKKTIASCLSNRTIAHSDMVAKLKAVLGDDVQAIELYSNVFSPDVYPIVTMVDDSMLPSIGKVLVALNNRTVEVQDAVSVGFLLHN